MNNLLLTQEGLKGFVEDSRNVIQKFDDETLLRILKETDDFFTLYTTLFLNNDKYKEELNAVVKKYSDNVEYIKHHPLCMKSLYFLIVSEALKRNLLSIGEIFDSNIEISIDGLDHFNNLMIDDELRNNLIRILNFYLGKIDDKYLNLLFKNIKSIDLKNKEVNENIENNELIEIGKILYIINPEKFDKIVKSFRRNYLSLLFSKEYVEKLNKKYIVEEKEEILYPFRIKYKVKYLKNKDGEVFEALIDNLIRFNVKRIPLRFIDIRNSRLLRLYLHSLNKYESVIYHSVLDLSYSERRISLELLWTDEHLLYTGMNLVLEILKDNEVSLKHKFFDGDHGYKYILRIPLNEFEVISI